MTVKRRKDIQTPRVIMHRIADIRGGVAVNVSELGGDYLPEGAVLSELDDGLCHVVKYAVLSAEASETDTEYKVAKFHNFAVGDYVMADVGGVAYAITAIDTTNKNYDVITLGTTLGVAISAGGFLIEAAEESTGSDSALKYSPLAINGTGKLVISGVNLDTDAWVIGVTKGNPLPDCIASTLKGIINY